MTELKPLNPGEIEVFMRKENEVLKVRLPSSFVNKLKDIQKEINAEDILEVLIKTSETMIETFNFLKNRK